jgi:glycosyltransferase involved in cell wall biosynthesis
MALDEIPAERRIETVCTAKILQEIGFLMAIEISVIICAHNPRRAYLQRVLDALRNQTLPPEHWEVLLIDNASVEPLRFSWDLSWHLNANHVREDELGLTPARLRGISEAKGEILVFVDDDNVLAPNYLEEGLKIGRDLPQLGAWGGTIRGEFEVQPEPSVQPLLAFLPVREFSNPLWSNNVEDWRAQPCGAGMCVRAVVAKFYAEQVAAQPLRRRLGRVGQTLSSCEDSDLIMTSCDLGMGFGNFPQLILTHLIPKSRVQTDYLIRLMKEITTSGVLLRYYRSGVLPNRQNRLEIWAKYLLILLVRNRPRAQIYKASQDAVRVGIEIAQTLLPNQDRGRTVATGQNSGRTSPTNPSLKDALPHNR